MSTDLYANYEEISESLVSAVESLRTQKNVYSPKDWELRRKAEPFGTLTEFGSVNFSTTVRNRSAPLTVPFGEPDVRQKNLNPNQICILRELPKTLEAVFTYMKKAPFVSIERTMGGDDSGFTPHCTLYVSTHRTDNVRIAFMWGETLFAPIKPVPVTSPRLTTVYIPEMQEKDRQMIAFPDVGISLLLGSDYFGEAKKSFLRQTMWLAKQRGMLGIHAGSKVIHSQVEGEIKKFGMVLFGLTATGKTTHSCHDHGLNLPGEKIGIAQDDVVILRDDGAVIGTEKGFFIKTDSLNPEEQPLLYDAAIRRNTLFENVLVDYLGRVFFLDHFLSGNGRAIIQRTDLEGKYSESINLPPLSEFDGLILAFITRRNTVLPLVSKLTPEQAAATFMLGESIHTSGSDPRRVGESIRVVGTNPFVTGDQGQEGNIFYNIVKNLEENYPGKLECCLLNTGGVGEILEEGEDEKKVIQKVLRVEIAEMASFIRGIVRHTIEWKKDDTWGVQVPANVEGVDLSKFELSNFYEPAEIKSLILQLQKERVEYLKQFPTLDPAILGAFPQMGE